MTLHTPTSTFSLLELNFTRSQRHNIYTGTETTAEDNVIPLPKTTHHERILTLSPDELLASAQGDFYRINIHWSSKGI